MKIKSLALASFTSACFLLTNSFALNALTHPGGPHTILRRPSSKVATPRATTTKNVFFNGYCVDVSLNVTDSGAVYGKSNQCGAPNNYASWAVVAGHVSMIDGIPNTIVISGLFQGLYGLDTLGRYRTIMIAIFPDNTFKAYAGSHLGATQALEPLATGTWSSTRIRSQGALRSFKPHKQSRAKAAKIIAQATTLRTFTINNYCKVEARITDGIVSALVSKSGSSTSVCYNYIPNNIGGVEVSGVPGIQDGTLVLNHTRPPGNHPSSDGLSHLHYLFAGSNNWWTYHASQSSLVLVGQGTYFESAPPRP